MHFLSAALPLALVSGVLASPAADLFRRGECGDSCCAQVTGSVAVGDANIRASHCSSYLATTVTPKAITVTTTVTGTWTTGASSSSGNGWNKRDVTVCPNSAPIYASACTNTAAYSSACSCFGITGAKTTTLAPTTTTKTVYAVPTGAGTCSASTKTVYIGSGSTWAATQVTTTVFPSTCASGVYPSGSKGYTSTTTHTTTTTHTSTTSQYPTPTAAPPDCKPDNGFCLTNSTATTIVNAFINFLTNTKANFNFALANQTLSPSFIDQSDSINYLIQQQTNSSYPALTTNTFGSRAAFESTTTGQAAQQAVYSVTTLNLWYTCTHITWRWALVLAPGLPAIQGINMMTIDDNGQLSIDYSEFNSALWLAQAKQLAAAAASGSTKKRSALHAH